MAADNDYSFKVGDFQKLVSLTFGVLLQPPCSTLLSFFLDLHSLKAF